MLANNTNGGFGLPSENRTHKPWILSPVHMPVLVSGEIKKGTFAVPSDLDSTLTLDGVRAEKV